MQYRHVSLSEECIAELRANHPLEPKPIFDVLVRLTDLVAASAALVALSPVLVAASCAIKHEDGGPVLFRQARLGRHGRSFEILKFRSMVPNASDVGARYRLAPNDSRITRIGKILRAYHIDEIPQLINVLRGDMSLVGPRPTLVFQKDYYEQWEVPRLAVRPGITGLSQVSGANGLTWDERIVIDVYYVRNRSFRMYASILAKTIIQSVTKKGIVNAEGTVKGWTRGVPAEYSGDL